MKELKKYMIYKVPRGYKATYDRFENTYTLYQSARFKELLLRATNINSKWVLYFELSTYLGSSSRIDKSTFYIENEGESLKKIDVEWIIWDLNIGQYLYNHNTIFNDKTVVQFIIDNLKKDSIFTIVTYGNQDEISKRDIKTLLLGIDFYKQLKEIEKKDSLINNEVK